MEIIKLNHKDDMQTYAQPVWELLAAAYANVHGGLLFADIDQLIASTHAWHLVIMDDQVQAVTIHKNKAGQKMVACAKAKTVHGKPALIHLLCHALQTGWMELSDTAERFVMLECNGHEYVMHSGLVKRLQPKHTLTDAQDKYHYQREINGMKKTKIALGTPDFTLCA